MNQEGSAVHVEEFPSNLVDIAFGTVAMTLLTVAAELWGDAGDWSAMVLTLFLILALAPVTVYAIRGETHHRNTGTP